jgi:hypothetical protein
VQVLGGYGYVSDFPAERHMREAKVLQIVEGPTRAADRDGRHYSAAHPVAGKPTGQIVSGPGETGDPAASRAGVRERAWRVVLAAAVLGSGVAFLDSTVVTSRCRRLGAT